MSQSRQYEVDQKGCWVWLGAKTHGYGTIGVKRKTRYAHIYFYEQSGGCLPDGYELDHLCRNTLCVNPDHMEAVTHAENNRRGRSTKLTKHQVEEIRSLVKSGLNQGDIAKRFGIHNSHVSRIAAGKVWTAE